MKFDKTNLLKAMKGFGYVTTTSGPVKPAKAKVIDVMTKQILKPVSKPQDSADWDDRRYEMNSALTSNHKYLTVKDMYSKVAKAVTEATTKTPYQGMRLNLKSIDMEETHCKFIITRHDVKVIVELYFPNANNAISVHISTETGLSNLYEVELDSDQFKNNFGISILKSIDDLMQSESEYNIGDDLDTVDYTNGMGTSIRDVNDTIVQPSALIRESVDGNLSKLLHLCNAITEAEDQGDTMSSDSQDAAGADAQAQGADQFAMNPDEPQATPVNSGDVNGTQESDDDSQMVNLKDFLNQKLSKGQISDMDTTTDSGIGGVIGNLKELLPQKLSELSSGQSADEIKNGSLAYKNQKANAVINNFCDLYSELTTTPIEEKKADELIDYLNDPREEVNLKNFEIKLQELFPDVYGNGIQAMTQSFDLGNLNLDGEDQINNQESFDENEPVDFDSSLNMPMSNDSEPSFMDDGSMSSMVDMLGQSDAGDDGDNVLPGDTNVGPAEDAASALPQIGA